MKKIPFDLSIWIKDRSQKLVTSFGEPAKIVFTEGMGNYPVLAVIWDGDTTDCQWFTKDGRDASGDQLYFFTEETELTEFEKHLKQLLDFAVACDTPYDTDCIKTEASDLLALAEKDLGLTPDDIDEIVHIYEVRKSVSADFDEEFYEDILNEYKRRKNNE